MTDAYLTTANAAVEERKESVTRWRALIDSVRSEFPPEVKASLGSGALTAARSDVAGILARARLRHHPLAAVGSLYLAAAYGAECLAADEAGVYAHVPRPSPVRRELVVMLEPHSEYAVSATMRYTSLTNFDGREKVTTANAYSTEEVVEFLHTAWQATRH